MAASLPSRIRQRPEALLRRRILELILEQILNGLTLGGVYSLVALGLTLVYGIMHVPNFAHGAFYMVGAFAAFYFMSTFGLNYWIAMAGAGVVVAVIAVLLVFASMLAAGAYVAAEWGPPSKTATAPGKAP